MRKIIKYSVIVVLFPVILFFGFLSYMSVTDYKPDDMQVFAEAENVKKLPDSLQFTFLIWNIGYSGLSAEMDFFYDGGEKVRPGKEIVDRNLNKIQSFLKSQKDVDFFLFQEVDIHSKRSYYTNQAKAIEEATGFEHSFHAKNYDVQFVPVPPSDPMGRVKSGLFTLGKTAPAYVARHSFKGNYAMPKSLFMLDRCFLETRFPLEKGKDLVVVNTHNSAYDDGSLRKKQLAQLQTFLEQEQKAGNYVVVGGDWNLCPPSFKPAYSGWVFDTISLSYIPGQYMKSWRWAYDSSLPTNRRVAVPYTKTTSRTTVIDYFLLSPNIILESVETIDLNFQYSDHQPVKLVISLNPN